MDGFRLRQTVMQLVDTLTQVAYRLSGGRLGGRQARYDILLLTTTGRKTGQARTHALLFIRDAEDYVVCASNFGAPAHPRWYLNLRADPRARLQYRRTHLAVVAHDAIGQERERLWDQLVRVWPHYHTYQQGGARVIPVVVLSPQTADSAGEA